MEKNFEEWMGVKEKLHKTGRLPDISEREIWWVAVGENVGVEINGKSNLYSRPVLIFKKLSRYGFLGVPLTSQAHDGPWYVNFEFQKKQQYANLAQIRVISVSRLYDDCCMGKISCADFCKIYAGFKRLYCPDK